MQKALRPMLPAALDLAFIMTATACSAPPPEKDATYRTLDALIAAVQASGLKCEGQLQRFPDRSSDYRTCGMNGWASTYATTSERDRQVKLQAGSTDSVMVVGPNWIVKAPLGDAKAVNEKLGGAIHE